MRIQGEKRKLSDTKYRDTASVSSPVVVEMDFFVIFAVAFLLLLLTNVLSKFLINQNDIKAKKDRIAELNKEMKDKKNDVDATKKLMGEILRENNSIFKMTMKPLLVSFIFVIIALPIIHGIYNDKFITQDSTEVEIGNIFQSQKYAVQMNGDEITVGDTSCKIPCDAQQINGAIFNIKKETQEGVEKIKLERVMLLLPFSLPYLCTDLGWLAAYIIISVPVMMIQKRFLKVYS